MAAVAKRVVVCVFDGLRPDMVTAKLTPHLAGFARRGTWFREARSVFPSMTRVATTSIATGTTPRHHGVVGNAFLFPAVTRAHVLDMSRAGDIAMAEAATGSGLVAVPAFGDALAAAGKRLCVVHTGSAGSAYLINPRAEAHGHWTFSILGRDHTQTPEAVDEVVARLGPLPPRTLPRFAETDYAARIMTDHVLPELKPDVALVWFNEPDTSGHYKLLGSADTLAVLARVDDAFGRILAWIDAQADAESYAVIVASDHGQISTGEQHDIVGMLGAQGHPTARPAARSLEGAAISITGGNMGEIRVLEGGAARRDAVAAWLRDQPFTGMIFSGARNEVEGEIAGTFALSLVELDHERQPDLVFVLRSSQAADPHGLPGVGHLTSGDVPPGGAMHGGLNRHELNTVLMVAASSMDAGRIDGRQSGIVDIAPTILDLLGLDALPTMTGHSLLAPDHDGPLRRFETGLGHFGQSLDVAMRQRSPILVEGGAIDSAALRKTG